MKAVILTSAMTGVFCAAFALVVDFVTEQLTVGQVILLAAASGSIGSLAAQLVLGRHK